MQNVINSIMSHEFDSDCLHKNRYIGYNIRHVEDVIEYYDHMHKKGFLFMADFFKVFDILLYQSKFILRTLDVLNFVEERSQQFNFFSREIFHLYRHHQTLLILYYVLCNHVL